MLSDCMSAEQEGLHFQGLSFSRETASADCEQQSYVAAEKSTWFLNYFALSVVLNNAWNINI